MDGEHRWGMGDLELIAAQGEVFNPEGVVVTVHHELPFYVFFPGDLGKDG
jgi:hypothetical protein